VAAVPTASTAVDQLENIHWIWSGGAIAQGGDDGEAQGWRCI
jgi:hypothetical protein